jgi:hypothetical protein
VAGTLHANASPLGPRQHVHQLGHLAPLLVGVAARDCVLDAMRDVIAQNLFLDAPERGAHRRDLRDDVEAIPVILDHAGEAAHLPFDPPEPFQAGGFRVILHDLTHTPKGYT